MHTPCPGRPEKERKDMENINKTTATKKNMNTVSIELKRRIRNCKKSMNNSLEHFSTVIPTFVADEEKALQQIRDKENVVAFVGNTNIDTNLDNLYEVRTNSVRKNGINEKNLTEGEVKDARDLASILTTPPTYEKVEPKGIRTSVQNKRRNDVIYVRSKKKYCYKKNYHNMEPQYHLKTSVHCRFKLDKFAAWTAAHKNLSPAQVLNLPFALVMDAAKASLYSVAYSHDPNNWFYQHPLTGSDLDAFVISEFSRWLQLPRVIKD